jgi:hypothetical protein
MGGGRMAKWLHPMVFLQKMLYNTKEIIQSPMKHLINLYLFSALSITTTAVIACFYWYVPEYYTAVKLDKIAPERAQIHRTNALWLGLWGGVYGLTGVVSAIGLSQGIKKD